MRLIKARSGVGEVFLVKTSDRNAGIRSLLERFDLDDYSGKKVAVKANFNSANPFPASTHLGTLTVLVKCFKEAGMSDLTLVERSGMGSSSLIRFFFPKSFTRTVLEQTGVFDLSKRLGFKVVVLDEEGREGWVKIDRGGTHWLRGFYIPKVFREADKIVQTCCLKTHRLGGHFTMSLKNSVGLVAKRIPGEMYDYMWEMHGSHYLRVKIAEINMSYEVDLVLMDAIKAYVNKGPDFGDVVEPNLLLASRDRVALDAVGVAILRSYGSTRNVMKGRIFELDQIRRAAEVGVGVKSASEIKLISLNDEGVEAATKIERILESQG